MSTICHPLPQPIIEDFLQIAARAICDRPGDTASQRASRTRQMVYSILGFEPRDGLEFMLATVVVGHFHLILDSMRAALWGQMDSEKARTKTGVVSLDRTMLGFVRELRLIRHRPLAGWAEDARRQSETADGPPQTPEWIASWAGVRPVAPAAPAPVVASPPAEVVPVAEAAATQVVPPLAPARVAPLSPSLRVAPLSAATRSVPVPCPVAPVEARPAAAAINRPVPAPDSDDAATARHIAEFEEALAALASSLEEARALDGTGTGAKVAGGNQDVGVKVL